MSDWVSREATGGDLHHSDIELTALRLGPVSDRCRIEPDLWGHAYRQSRAWQSLCCRRLCNGLACRARYCAWGAAWLAVPAAAGGGPVGGADRDRDRASAAPAVLSPGRGIPAACYLWPVANPRGSHAAHLGRNTAVGRYADGCTADSARRWLVLSRLQSAGHRHRYCRGRDPLGGDLPYQVRRDAARDLPGPADGLSAGSQCWARLCCGLRDWLFHGRPWRRDRSPDPGGGAGHGR